MQKIKLIIAFFFIPLLTFAQDSSVKGALSTSTSALMNAWNYKLFSLENQSITISSLIIGLISLIIGFRVARYFGAYFKKKLFSFIELDKNSTNLISRVIDYTLMSIVVIIVLDIARVPLTIFTFIGGAFVVSVGLSSQHLVNNFISGISLIIEGKVKVGDLIELEGTAGRVDSIESRVIELRTQDNVQIFIPHSKLMQEQFTHWTYNGGIVRLSTGFKIDQKDKTNDDANFDSIILNAIAQSPGVLNLPKPELLLAELDTHILCYEARFWINLADSDRKVVISEVNKSVLNTLNVHHILLAIPNIKHIE
jgi:potassium efflux system protein